MTDSKASKFFVFNPLVLGCMCNRNKDGSKNLILNGSQLFHRIGRRIVDGDMNIICEFLKENPKVKHLYLPYNNITSKGIKELVELLKENKNIETINLMNNDINDKGILRLAKLGNDLNLITLRLNGNPIGERGGRHLALLLLNNSKLRHLDVAQSDQSCCECNNIILYDNPLWKKKEKEHYIN